MNSGYEYFWLPYLSAGQLYSTIAQLLLPGRIRYIEAMAALRAHCDDPSERMICRLIPRHEVPHLPRHIEAAIANAYSILGDYVEAVDITATVLVRIEQAPGEPRDFRSYLIVSVGNEARRRAKWRKRHEQLPTETFEESLSLVTYNTPERELIRKELCTQVRNVIETLPVEQREIIYLRFYEELSFKEIAELKGLSVGAVKARIHRALANLAPRVLLSNAVTYL